MSCGLFGDPFICHYSKTEVLQGAGSEVSFPNRNFSGYFHQLNTQWDSRICPSGPISPSVSFSSSESCCSTPSVDDYAIKAEPPFHSWPSTRGEIPLPIKVEPAEEFRAPSVGHLYTSSATFSNDFYSERIGYSPESELEERYQDFMQFVRETTDLDGLELDMPYESLDGYASESSDMRKKNLQKPRKAGSSPRTSSGQRSSPAASKSESPRKRKASGNDTRFEQSRNTSSLSGDDASSATSSKRSKGLSSEESYAQRRAKNNTAVRKSREKKRQESQRFLEEHEKLKKEIEMIKGENDQLQSVLAEVEDGLLDTGKSKEDLTALVQSAKKRLVSH